MNGVDDTRDHPFTVMFFVRQVTIYLFVNGETRFPFVRRVIHTIHARKLATIVL